VDLLAFAQSVAASIETAAQRAGIPLGVCVIDVHGNIVLKHRMDGAPGYATDLAERKAYTSALVGLRTTEINPLVQPGQPLFHLIGVSGGRYCAMGGGAPLTRDGQRVAGVGVSGGTVDQDVSILEEGLRDLEVAI
jgi:uncharacterized protein GlcG (DUF336 family)